MSPTVACDISEFQPVVDDTYTRDWLIFRACDGDYEDQHAVANLAWSVKARAAGKIQGFTCYVVYRPGKETASLAILDRLRVPTDCVLMIDAESWGGQISGDHSTQINALADRLRARQGGDADLVWAYGNRGPDLTVWPHKPSWAGWVVASYGGSKPDVPNLVGWQYTDNHSYDVGLPTTSAPFGHCDHNALYQLPTGGLSVSDVTAIRSDIASLRAHLNDWMECVIHGDKSHPNSQDGTAKVLADVLTRLAALQAEVDQLKSARVQVNPTSVPVTGTLTVGAAQ